MRIARVVVEAATIGIASMSKAPIEFVAKSM
ncbi:hypothetical protein ACVWY3_004932 [Bradyrhizobium sp. USDA 4486]